MSDTDHTTIISEVDFYRLATTSRKPVAQRFSRWLFGEVLPEIRRTGSYRGGSAPLDALISHLAEREQGFESEHLFESE